MALYNYHKEAGSPGKLVQFNSINMVSLYIKVGIEINGDIVEDTSWLRKMTDSTHINLPELVALLKEINLALK